MAARGKGLLGELSTAIGDLAGVTSTAQWGGRAWKRPIGGAKTKLLAHVCLTDDDRAVTVSFKLDPARARAECEAHDWIEPHSFRTLAPAGWVTATVRTRRHAGAVTKLLAESYALYGPPPETGPGRDDSKPRAASHIDRVMGELRADGWQPRSDW